MYLGPNRPGPAQTTDSPTILVRRHPGVRAAPLPAFPAQRTRRAAAQRPAHRMGRPAHAEGGGHPPRRGHGARRRPRQRLGYRPRLWRCRHAARRGRGRECGHSRASLWLRLGLHVLPAALRLRYDHNPRPSRGFPRHHAPADPGGAAARQCQHHAPAGRNAGRGEPQPGVQAPRRCGRARRVRTERHSGYGAQQTGHQARGRSQDQQRPWGHRANRDCCRADLGSCT